MSWSNVTRATSATTYTALSKSTAPHGRFIPLQKITDAGGGVDFQYTYSTNYNGQGPHFYITNDRPIPLISVVSSP